MNTALSIRDLVVKYEDFEAVKNISMDVKPGEVRGLLGGNGAGKSTTLRVCAGVVRPTSGQIIVGGYDITRSYKESTQGRATLGYCPDVGGLVSGATPLDHVRLVAHFRRDPTLFDRGKEAINEFALGDFADTPISGFSHGMMRRLGVLLAYITAQTVLILDEPYDGVDPLGVDIINKVVEQAKQENKGVIISTHLQPLLVAASDTISVMAKGHLLTTAESETLTNPEQYKNLLMRAED